MINHHNFEIGPIHKCQICNSSNIKKVMDFGYQPLADDLISFKEKSRKTIFLQIKKRNEPALLNYKKFLSEKTKNTLSEAQKYLLSIREIDFTQKEDSVGPGDMYRKIYGKDRGAIQKWLQRIRGCGTLESV